MVILWVNISISERLFVGVKCFLFDAMGAYCS
jgi:hypothetical protein